MSDIIESCNNTSVGILVVRDDRLLIIERRRTPYGWAPPAGHVDAGETYYQAAMRELWEEVGLHATNLFPLHQARYNNQCRRPGGDHHQWEVFGAETTGDPVRSEDETSAMHWVTVDELVELREISRKHLTSGVGPDEWRAAPGLEPVWMRILIACGWAEGK
jgi:8-oxo-dGTP pyrophosphatase MutT (NUDIX family)